MKALIVFVLFICVVQADLVGMINRLHANMKLGNVNATTMEKAKAVIGEFAGQFKKDLELRNEMSKLEEDMKKAKRFDNMAEELVKEMEMREERILLLAEKMNEGMEEVADIIGDLQAELKNQKEHILQMQKKIDEQQSTIDILIKE